jgi:hypothetical protein
MSDSRKRAAVLLVGLSLLTTSLGGVASATSKSGGGTPGVFVTSVSPGTAVAGTSVDFTVQMQNNTSDTTIGSVNTKAVGFTLTSASTPSGSAAVVNNVAQFRNLGLAPSSSVAVHIVATVPCAPGRYKMQSTAKTSSDFSGVTFAASGAGPIRVSGACALSFQTQPANATVDATISGTAFDPEGPPVSVQALDGNGAPVSTSGGSVSMAIGANPTGGSLHGTTTEAIVNGVATFDDLSIDVHGVGYTLVATSGAATVTSDAFTIADAGADCSGSCTIEATASDGTEASLTNFSSSGDAFLIWNVDTVDCPGYEETTGTLTFGSSGDGEKRVIITIPADVFTRKPDVGWQVCFGTDGDATFTDRDGQIVSVGLLPDCGAVDGVAPCVISRQHNTDGSLSVIFRAPAGDPKGRL